MNIQPWEAKLHIEWKTKEWDLKLLFQQKFNCYIKIKSWCHFSSVKVKGSTKCKLKRNKNINFNNPPLSPFFVAIVRTYICRSFINLSSFFISIYLSLYHLISIYLSLSLNIYLSIPFYISIYKYITLLLRNNVFF